MNAKEDILFKDEAFAIVGAAMEVHSVLGHGFLEAVYADAMALELRRRDIPFQREVPISLTYKGDILPHAYRADFLVYDQIILELKAIKALADSDRAQALHYLKATGHSLAILANFGAPKLDWMRLVLTN
ncbi:MAG: GxxExxY protein [Geothrix sp.]|nr:GxxExxY protein [Geothrix sp.]